MMIRYLLSLLLIFSLGNAFATTTKELDEMNPEAMVTMKAKSLQDVLDYLKNLQQTLANQVVKIKSLERHNMQLKEKCTF